MQRRTTSPTLFLALGFFALACSDGGSTRVDEEVRHLRRTGDGSAYVVVPGGIAAMGDLPGDGPPAPGDEPVEIPWDPGMPDDGGYYPDPGMPSDCAFLRYREIATTVLDASGNVISTSYEFCTQCFAADLEPVGEETCASDPLPSPPTEPVCWEEVTPEGELCSACIDEYGVIIEDTCGYYTDPGVPPTDPGETFCWVDTAPDGTSCDVCVDATGVIITDECGYYTDPGVPTDPGEPFCWEDVGPDGSVCRACADPTTGELIEDTCGYGGDPGAPPDEPCPPPPGGEGSDPDDGTLPDGM